jgi:type IV secretory pathway VirB9-like protein
MRRSMALLLLCLVWGCSHEEPLPPVPHPPEDMSFWSVPELVQPPPPPEPVPIVPKEKPTSAELVYAFTPGTTFAVTVAINGPLDIVLARGEQVRNIVGGDRAPAEASQTPRWEVREGADGQGDTLRPHIFLTASAPGLSTGLILTTTARTYYLACKSVKTSPTRVVRWTYVDSASEKPLVAKAPGLLPDPRLPARYHVGYEITSTGAHPPTWLPRQIVDDGKKVYIIYAEVTLFDTVPMLRLIGPNGPQLVNARQFLNVVIVDQLVGRAELRVGLGETAETVTLTRGALRTIACPGDEACPVWPHAAQGLAQRTVPVVHQAAAPAPPPPTPPLTPPPAPPEPPKPEEDVPQESVPPQGDTP